MGPPRPRSPWLAAAVLLGLVLAAAPAQAGHSGAPVPDGILTVHVLFLTVVNWAPAPTSHVDQAWTDLCAATAGMPVRCTYQPRTCMPNDLALFCTL